MIKAVLLVAAGVLTTIGVVKVIDYQNLDTDTLVLLVKVCELDANEKVHEDLVNIGVAPGIFIHDESYRQEICNKTETAATSGKSWPIRHLESFTHHYASLHGITLPDSYTSRWPEP